MAKLLLAEDDSKLAKLIVQSLSADNHLVEWVGNGQEALDRINVSQYELLILDWTMPGADGIQICKHYRDLGGDGRILILTGKTEIADKVTGFDAGADDYLTKPFHIKELSLRVRALLKRPTELRPDVFKVRDLELDTNACSLTKNGVKVELYPREFSILEFLMRHPNRVFTIEELQSHIWASESSASPETIRSHITRLRSKIEDDTMRPLIKTVHRQGYLLDNNE